NSGNPPLWDFQTNIPVPNAAPAYDPTFYGYDFTHWILRLSYTGPYAAGSGQAVTQSFEIIVDNYGQPNAPTTAYSAQGYHSFRVSPIDHPSLSSTDATQPDLNPYPSANTVLSNPTQGITTQMAYIQSQNGQGRATFILDGRWLHAFNGPGMGPYGVWGN